MFFILLKSYARLCLRIYCRSLVINKPDYLKIKGPVLFAANHPNSFLDGIVLTTLLEETLYSLARGDAFTPRWKGFLRSMHLLPVYRTSEGVGNLAHNYATFAACHEVFAQKGAVLIFSEGRCLNEWHLRPLLKGTARLATSAWQKGIPLTVIPVGFNYSSFKYFGPQVHLLFGEKLDPQPILEQAQEGRQLASFNQQLEAKLQPLVYELDPLDRDARNRVFNKKLPAAIRAALTLPAALGWLLHAPLYYSVRRLASLSEAEHFDSIVAALLLLLYPFYLLAVVLVAGSLAGWQAAWLVVLMPLLARAVVLWKLRG